MKKKPAKLANRGTAQPKGPKRVRILTWKRTSKGALAPRFRWGWES